MKFGVNTLIIGLSGYAQSGKDSVANLLVKNYGFTRVAFADKIKDILYEMNPIVGFDYDAGPKRLRDSVDSYTWDVAKQYPEVRRLLQDVGVGARSHLGTSVWIEAALANLIESTNYVFTDVRFPNEAEALKQKNATLVRIERPGVVAVNKHISEHAAQDINFDYNLVNGGDLETLSVRVKHLFEVVSSAK